MFHNPFNHPSEGTFAVENGTLNGCFRADGYMPSCTRSCAPAGRHATDRRRGVEGAGRMGFGGGVGSQPAATALAIIVSSVTASTADMYFSTILPLLSRK